MNNHVMGDVYAAMAKRAAFWNQLAAAEAQQTKKASMDKQAAIAGWLKGLLNKSKRGIGKATAVIGDKLDLGGKYERFIDDFVANDGKLGAGADLDRVGKYEDFARRQADLLHGADFNPLTTYDDIVDKYGLSVKPDKMLMPSDKTKLNKATIDKMFQNGTLKAAPKK